MSGGDKFKKKKKGEWVDFYDHKEQVIGGQGRWVTLRNNWNEVNTKVS